MANVHSAHGREVGAGTRVVVVAGVLLAVVAGFAGFRVLNPRTDEPEGVTAPAQNLTDLAYAQVSSAQRLDLYLPRRTGEAIPLVINIHGGAFRFGDKKDETGNVQALLAEGFAVASLNYRLSGEARFPAGVQDVKAAVRWLRAQAPTYGLHPEKFAVWGPSAGGHLAAMVGVTGGQPTRFDAPELGNPGVSSAVQAVVDWFGPTDFLTMDPQQQEAKSRGAGCTGTPDVHDARNSPESLWLGSRISRVPDLVHKASPMRYLQPGVDVPPFFITHGTADCIVAYGQSEQLAAALKAAGKSVELHPVDGAVHSDVRITETQTAPSIAFVKRALGV